MTTNAVIPMSIERDPILKIIWTKVNKKDRNALIVACGQTGSGKSVSMIELCRLLDPGFTIDRVVFTASDFVKLVQGKLPTGSCIIWDEIGVENDARNYFDLKNKLIKYIFQTFRFQNLIVFMTVPDLPSIDISTRRLAHYYIEMSSKGAIRRGKDEFTLCKFRHIYTHPQSGKVFLKIPRFIIFDRVTGIVTNLRVPTMQINKPPEYLVGQYLLKKNKMTTNWYNEISAQMQYMEQIVGEKHSNQNSKSTQEDLREVEAKILADPGKYFNFDKSRFVPEVISQEFGINDKASKRIKAILEHKLRNNEFEVKRV